MHLIHWTEADTARTALWHAENGAAAPKRAVVADDTLGADAAYRLACEGTALIWRGDFQNARQMLQALARRADRKPARAKRAGAAGAAAARKAGSTPKDQFNLHRQAQSQRARLLAMLLIPLSADYSIPLRRAPDWRQACTEAYGAPQPHDGDGSGDAMVSLRELLGLVGAHEWRKKGVEVPALGPAPGNRIHPHYGVFSPVRGEYLALVADTPLPACLGAEPGTPFAATVFDIGTGTGVLSALLARRGASHVVATDMDPRALACATENLARLGCADAVQVIAADLFPPLIAHGLAGLIVCNPPWLPARPSSRLEHAVYDPDSGMLRGFLAGLAAHLAPGGEGWLILSDLAEHLGLRTRAELLDHIAASGLQVLGRSDVRPLHRKATDPDDPLHGARAAEVTSLWRLGAGIAVH